MTANDLLAAIGITLGFIAIGGIAVIWASCRMAALIRERYEDE